METDGKHAKFLDGEEMGGRVVADAVVAELVLKLLEQQRLHQHGSDEFGRVGARRVVEPLPERRHLLAGFAGTFGGTQRLVRGVDLRLVLRAGCLGGVLAAGLVLDPLPQSLLPLIFG